jgi:glycosyltransferase involved in cell wall biosynthesis
MQSPISVVIPTFNRSALLVTTLQSVLQQTHPALEIIVVDDGSTDDTQQVLEPFSSHITVLRQPNRGLAGARNTGFQAATGEYILFLDSDDLLLPNALEHFADFLNRHSEYGLVYSAWQQIDQEGKILGEIRPGRDGNLLIPLLKREFFIFCSMTVFRRACLEQVGTFDEELRWSEDADMWLRLGAAGYAFGYIDEPLVQYRFTVGSMTADVRPEQVDGWMRGLRKFFAERNLSPEIRSLEKQAYQVLHFETAGRYFRYGDVQNAQSQLRAAHELDAPIDTDWVVNWLVGTALDPRTPDPQELIDRVFDNLPPELTFLQTLSRQTQTQLQTASAFAAYQNHQLAKVREHGWNALRSNPRLLLNRGFVRILTEAWMKNN